MAPRIMLTCLTLLLACGDDGGSSVSDSAAPPDAAAADADTAVADADGPIAPGAPEGLLAVGLMPSVALSWQPSSSGSTAVSYTVYRDDVEIGQSLGTRYVDRFSDSQPPTRCTGNSYHVVAHDAAGKASAPSGKTTSRLPMKHLVFMIGDGMGPEQQRAAGCYRFGPAQGSAGNTLAFETLPVHGTVRTASADNPITDSAASGTAMATGHSVANGVVSVALPGDGSERYTLLECFKDQGRMTGLVTTTEISHATPATFGAHSSDRGEIADIVADYLTQTRPNLLLGGVNAAGITPGAAQAAGYTVVTTRAALQQAPASTTHLSGQFHGGHLPYELDAATASPNPYDALPHLSEMTSAALNRLAAASPQGFFLLVEGGRIDHACHANDLARAVLETVEFDKATRAVIDWASTRTDTLVIVTADHETGGLDVKSCGKSGALPTVTWSSGNHTATEVNVYASGVRAERLTGSIANTDFFRAIVDGAE